MIKLAPVFECENKDGKLIVKSGSRLLNYLLGMPKIVYITVKKKKAKPRSLSQNRYYFGGVLEMISEATGYEKEEVHEIMKVMFIKRNIRFGLEVPCSTTDLTTIEFNEYIEKIRAWASRTLSLDIPDARKYELEVV